ncbi:AraC-type DNA-binding protein [Streptococcus henryi]|uniref:AraC-type DNA-binding protein n=1 Tax=Streptococcus henryi TaxID=439219 RepID=A0A1G6ARP9_9STRE|nr:helix-turn-helix domain-containing protein [Streptococcus henryi]SDB11058.1 AraC-type DNA-binding protein [Streptococcus henryi]
MTKTKIWENVSIIQLKAKDAITNFTENAKLVYVLSGKIEVAFDDYTMTFGLGEFFVVPNFITVKILNAERSSRFYAMEFAYWSENEDKGKIDVFEGDSKSKGEASNSTLSQSLGRMLRLYYLEKESASYWEVNALYFQIISKLEQKYLVKLEGNKWQLSVENIEAYLNQNISEDLSLEGLAEVFYVSKQSMSRFMKKHFDISFSKYLQEKRFEKLELLLATSDTPINSLVYEVGFKNLNSFNRLFRKKYNLSPREWRQGHSKEVGNSTETEEKLSFDDFQSFMEDSKSNFSFNANQSKKSQSPKYIWNLLNLEALGDYQTYRKIKFIQSKLTLDTLRFPLDLQKKEEVYFDSFLDFLEDRQIKPYMVIDLSDSISNNRSLNYLKSLYQRYGAKQFSQYYIEFRSQVISQETVSEYKRLCFALKQMSSDLQCGFGDFNIYADKDKMEQLMGYSDLEDSIDFIAIEALPIVKEPSLYSSRENIVLGSNVKAISRKIDDFLAISRTRVPFILSGYNLTADNLDDINDSAYKSGYCLAFLEHNEDKFAKIGYASLLDNWSLELANSAEFIGLSGLVTKSGLPKVELFAYDFKSRLQDYLIAKEDGLILTTDRAGSYTILAHNHQKLTDYYSSSRDINLHESQNYVFETQGRHLQVELTNIPNGTYQVTFTILGPNDGNALDEARKYTALKQFDVRMLDFLKSRIQPTIYQKQVQVHDSKLLEKLILKPLEVILVEFRRLL